MSLTSKETHRDALSSERLETGSLSPNAGVESTKVSQSTDVQSLAEAELNAQYNVLEDQARFEQLRARLTGWRWYLFLANVAISAAISGYDVSNLSTIQVSIYEAFGHIELLPWVVTAFSLGNSATCPTLNEILKLVDLKWFMLASLIVFAAASAVVGASPTIEGVIVGRAILGVATGGVLLSLLTYNTILSGPKQHTRVNGLVGLSFAVGLILGPVIGSAFAQNEHATWRWAFYICVPTTGITMLLTLLVYPSVRLYPQLDTIKELRRIDWLGSFLHMSTLVLFDAACIFSGSTLPWRSGVIAMWVLSGILGITYAIQQMYSILTTPAKRIFPHALMSTRTGSIVMLATFFTSSAYGVTLYYLPLFFAFTRGDTTFQLAVHVLPYICVYIAGSITSTILLPILHRYAPFYLISGVLVVAGAAAMQSVDATTSLGQVMGISTLIGFGVGSVMQLGASVLALALPPAIRIENGIAMTLTTYTGITVALAITGCIYDNIGFDFLSNALRGSGLSDAQVRSALAGVESPVWQTLSGGFLTAGLAAVGTAIVRLFYYCTVAGVLVLLCSLAMKWEALEFRPATEMKDEGVQDTPPQEEMRQIAEL